MLPGGICRSSGSGQGACLVNGDVIVVVAKGRLDLDANLLEAQQLVAHHHAHYQVPVRTLTFHILIRV